MENGIMQGLERKVEFETIIQVDVVKGKIFADIDSILEIILDNSNRKLSNALLSSRNEDTLCPENEFVDEVIAEMKADFKSATGQDIECIGYWGHIHEHNMSTNTHNHGNAYVSAVLYLSVPEGSGSLVFVPRLNQYDNSMYKSSISPEKGSYYMFPGYLDHYVTRNASQEKRVSISFNFKKI